MQSRGQRHTSSHTKDHRPEPLSHRDTPATPITEYCVSLGASEAQLDRLDGALIQLRRSVASRCGPEEGVRAFAEATSGTRGELPYRARMEEAFGEDFSSVAAYRGRADDLAPLGAEAAASGEVVTFADEHPSEHTVAHELTHVVQARRGGGGAVQGRGGISSPTSAAEVEAEQVAGQVVAGERVTVGESASGIHRTPAKGEAKRPWGQVEWHERPYRFRLHDFGQGEADLGVGHHAALEEAWTALSIATSGNPHRALESVVGYASSEGGTRSNQVLSELRAAAVRDAIGGLGDPMAQKATIKGRGELDSKQPHTYWRAVEVSFGVQSVEFDEEEPLVSDVDEVRHRHFVDGERRKGGGRPADDSIEDGVPDKAVGGATLVKGAKNVVTAVDTVAKLAGATGTVAAGAGALNVVLLPAVAIIDVSAAWQSAETAEFCCGAAYGMVYGARKHFTPPPLPRGYPHPEKFAEGFEAGQNAVTGIASIERDNLIAQLSTSDPDLAVNEAYKAMVDEYLGGKFLFVFPADGVDHTLARKRYLSFEGPGIGR